MIIDPDGLFNGDRLHRCSNLARLYFPYLLLMSNGFGRIEVNYQRIVDRAFAKFDPQPSQSEIEKVILEYHSQHLLFLYEGADGQLWGQWDVRPALLKKHKSAADLRSPSPPSDDLQKWLEEYRKSKQQSNTGISDHFKQILGLLPKSEQISENHPKSPEVSDDFPLGVGVGVGVGDGDGKKKGIGEPFNSTDSAVAILRELRVPTSPYLIDATAQAIGFIAEDTGNPIQATAEYLMGQMADYLKVDDPQWTLLSFIQNKKYGTNPATWSKQNAANRPNERKSPARERADRILEADKRVGAAIQSRIAEVATLDPAGIDRGGAVDLGGGVVLLPDRSGR